MRPFGGINKPVFGEKHLSKTHSNSPQYHVYFNALMKPQYHHLSSVGWLNLLSIPYPPLFPTLPPPTCLPPIDLTHDITGVVKNHFKIQ